MSELFNVDVRTINDHLESIYGTEELSKDSTIRYFRIVQKKEKGMLLEMLYFII